MLYAPFLLIYALIALVLIAGLFAFVEIALIRAFMVLGLSKRVAVLALLISLLGSYVNVPLYAVESGPVPMTAIVNDFGVTYRVPYEYGGNQTTVAINLGGAVVPILISAYALLIVPVAFVPSVLGTAIVSRVTHQVAYPLKGVGIVLPLFVAPLAAAFVAIVLAQTMRAPRITHVIAYVGGVLGTLIGADLTNLHLVANLGAPVASIGGAGSFDGVFLTGIVAVLLAGF